jgi:hypothetical protein
MLVLQPQQKVADSRFRWAGGWDVALLLGKVLLKTLQYELLEVIGCILAIDAAEILIFKLLQMLTEMVFHPGGTDFSMSLEAPAVGYVLNVQSRVANQIRPGRPRCIRWNGLPDPSRGNSSLSPPEPRCPDLVGITLETIRRS